MLNKIAKVIAAVLVVGCIFALPHIYEYAQFNNGTMLKVVESYEVQPTDQGGFAKHFTVQDHQGKTHEVYTGFVAQWDKSAGDYINQKYLKGVN